MMRDELSHKRALELAQAQSPSTTNPVVWHFDILNWQLLCMHTCYNYYITSIQSQPQAVDNSRASDAATLTISFDQLRAINDILHGRLLNEDGPHSFSLEITE